MKNKMIDFLELSKTRKIFIVIIALWGLLGTINVLINFEQAMKMLGNSWARFTLTIIGNFAVSAISIMVYACVISIVTYFIAAAMNKGFDIKVFIRISIKSLLFAPLIAISDMIAFILIGEKFTVFNKFVGVASYLPFYIMTFLLFFSLIAKSIDISKMQRIVISCGAVISLIFASFPY